MAKGIPNPLGESRGHVTEIDDSHGETHTGITIFDKSEPRSVYNLVTNEMQACIDRVNPNIWGYSFKALEKHARPDATLAQLRVAFWHQYNEAQDKWKGSISLTRVFHGICSKPHFYKYLNDQLSLAYMLYPTTDYIASMKEMHDLSLREMRKILTMPNGGKKGANLPIIREKIKIWALLENRLRGAVPVRVQQDSRHLHVHAGQSQINDQHQAAPKSLKEIEKEINKIGRTTANVTREAAKETIDVAPVPQGDVIE